MQKLKLALIAGALCAALFAGALVFTGSSTPAHAERGRVEALAGSAALDGLTFDSELGPVDGPADVKDTLVFENGMFLSAECEKRCNYPASPYYVRRSGERIEFVSETLCPDKDATLVWRGVVEGGTVRGKFTWTVSRWYWTVEKVFRFEGRAAKGASPPAGA